MGNDLKNDLSGIIPSREEAARTAKKLSDDELIRQSESGYIMSAANAELKIREKKDEDHWKKWAERREWAGIILGAIGTVTGLIALFKN